MGFNSGFKGLIVYSVRISCTTMPSYTVTICYRVRNHRYTERNVIWYYYFIIINFTALFSWPSL